MLLLLLACRSPAEDEGGDTKGLADSAEDSASDSADDSATDSGETDDT